MSRAVQGPSEDELRRQVGELLTRAKTLTSAAADRPGTRFLDYMISLALIEVATPTKE